MQAVSGRLIATEGQAAQHSLPMVNQRATFRGCRFESIGVRTRVRRLLSLLEQDVQSRAVAA